MMNDELVRSLAVALRYRKLYEDSNPEVGFGPSLEMLAEEVITTAQIQLSIDNINSVVRAYKQRWYTL